MRSPIRVCFPFAGHEVGGSHVSALGLLRHLDPARFTPVIILDDADDDIARLFRASGLSFMQAPRSAALGVGERIGISKAPLIFTNLLALTDLLRAQEIAIVHSNDGRSHATWALPAKLSGAKLLWHHRGDPRASGVRLAAPLLADRVVAVSRFAAPEPGLYSAARKTSVVPSPFDTGMHEDRAAARAILVAELGCAPETHIIGFFGTLVERKRPTVFVEAIAELRRQLPATPIVGLLFGDSIGGMDETVRRRVRELGVEDSVKLMGFRYPGSRWLAACDVHLVTAVNEPFGRTLIEAMLLETPVVAARSGGNSEALRDGETGLLAPPDDPAAIAAAVRRVLLEPGLARALCVAARADARARFSERGHAEAIMRIYDEMLTRGRASASHNRAVPRAVASVE